jgi:hypothetical protein
MLGVVLGNGPSKRAYDNTGDYVIGCNIPSDNISVDATVICDEEIIWVIKNNLTLIQVPVIISTRVFEKMKEFRIVEHFDIVEVFKPRDWYNAAHYAADFLIRNGCDEVHLWGCDSIFDGTTSSTTNKIINSTTLGDDRFIKNWRRVWNEIHVANPDVHFVAMRMPK